MTLTSDPDLDFRIILSVAYLILFEEGIPNGLWVHLGMTKCRVPTLGHCDLDLNLDRVWYTPPISFEVGIPN